MPALAGINLLEGEGLRRPVAIDEERWEDFAAEVKKGLSLPGGDIVWLSPQMVIDLMNQAAGISAELIALRRGTEEAEELFREQLSDAQAAQTKYAEFLVDAGKQRLDALRKEYGLTWEPGKGYITLEE